MRRSMTFAAIILIVTLALTGCDWLFGPSVDQVNPSDLESFTASRTFTGTTEDELYYTTFFVAFNATSAYDGIYAGVEAELATQTSVSSFEDLFNVLIERSAAEAQARARSLAESPSASIVAEDNSTNDTLDLEVTVTDETVNATDLSLSGGTALVNFYLRLNGSDSSTDNGDGTYTVKSEGEGEHNGSVVYDEWSSDGVYVIHDGRINTTASGRYDVDAVVDETSQDGYGTASWELGMAMSAGFSVSNLSTGEGGKIILDFTYRSSDEVQATETQSLTSQATSEVEATMTVVLYDNNNTEIARYEYSGEDAAF